MLPQSYQLPAAVLLLVGGVIACFAGYRLFRFVLVVYGFLLGALLASSAMGVSDSGAMIVAALVGGLVGAAILYAAYFVGVALVGAGLGALAAHVLGSAFGLGTGIGGDPHPLIVIVFSVAGALGAVVLQRYVIIVGTAFGGAWTLIVAGRALAGDRGAMAAATTGDVWIAYPLDPAPGRWWVVVAWLVLGLIGLATQLGWTAKKKVGSRQ